MLQCTMEDECDKFSASIVDDFFRAWHRELYPDAPDEDEASSASRSSSSSRSSQILPTVSPPLEIFSSPGSTVVPRDDECPDAEEPERPDFNVDALRTTASMILEKLPEVMSMPKSRNDLLHAHTFISDTITTLNDIGHHLKDPAFLKEIQHLCHDDLSSSHGDHVSPTLVASSQSPRTVSPQTVSPRTVSPRTVSPRTPIDDGLLDDDEAVNIEETRKGDNLLKGVFKNDGPLEGEFEYNLEPPKKAQKINDEIDDSDDEQLVLQPHQNMLDGQPDHAPTCSGKLKGNPADAFHQEPGPTAWERRKQRRQLAGTKSRNKDTIIVHVPPGLHWEPYQDGDGIWWYGVSPDGNSKWWMNDGDKDPKPYP